MTARMAATMSETSAADASTPQPLGMPATDFTSHQLREARARAVSLAAQNERLVTALGNARERIAELGLEDTITIRGTVKVRQWLTEFDLFLLPSYNEGLPVVSLETMGAGIPTVSTDVGAVRSVVEDMIVTDDGQTWDPCGIIIEPGDPTVMADKVQEVISDVDLYERLSLNARGRVEAAYDLVKVNASYNPIYRQGGAGKKTVTSTDQGGA